MTARAAAGSVPKPRPLAFVGRMASPTRHIIEDALAWVEADRVIHAGSRVFLKPNLTWRTPVAGVTTTPDFIATVVEAIRDRTPNVMIGEANGGYHSFAAEESFTAHGLYELARRPGVHVVNLSQVPSARFTSRVLGREMTVELPRLLIEEIDVFITLPVPKVHAMTRVSLGFKNQWGCQPGTMRLRNHPEFARKLVAINRLLRPAFALFDGTYFLDRTGPMIGDAVRMELTVAANDLGAGDLVCCDIMGIAPRSVPHLRLARREGLMPGSLDEVDLNRPLGAFRTHRFQLERSLINYVTLAAFHSRVVTRLFYDSAAAGPLHTILYRARRNPVIARLLYGPTGPPTVEGHR